ncbi:MAG TPA: DMT family transporter [Nitrospira sp.]|nr:DMT family transporter [Nitrospira sp.]
MSLPGRGTPSRERKSSQLVPILCLLGVVALLSSITPATKFVFRQSGMSFLDLACGRVVIGFLFLAAVTAFLDRRGLCALRLGDCLLLGSVGFLGVGAYAIAAWGLQYTSVTHYALVYSLLPTFTTLLSCMLGRDRSTPLMWLGILLSWGGCVLAISDGFRFQDVQFEFGDALALLFTAMMSAHIAFSGSIVKRHGVLTSNTAMFGTSALLISACTVTWADTPQQDNPSMGVLGAVLFIGLGTAGVFLLRCRSLQSLSPATVGAYHNLIPISTIGIAHLSLDEPLTLQTVVGAAAVMLGTEIVRRGPLDPNWLKSLRLLFLPTSGSARPPLQTPK